MSREMCEETEKTFVKRIHFTNRQEIAMLGLHKMDTDMTFFEAVEDIREAHGWGIVEMMRRADADRQLYYFWRDKMKRNPYAETIEKVEQAWRVRLFYSAKSGWAWESVDQTNAEQRYARTTAELEKTYADIIGRLKAIAESQMGTLDATARKKLQAAHDRALLRLEGVKDRAETDMMDLLREVQELVIKLREDERDEKESDS